MSFFPPHSDSHRHIKFGTVLRIMSRDTTQVIYLQQLTVVVTSHCKQRSRRFKWNRRIKVIRNPERGGILLPNGSLFCESGNRGGQSGGNREENNGPGHSPLGRWVERDRRTMGRRVPVRPKFYSLPESNISNSKQLISSTPNTKLTSLCCRRTNRNWFFQRGLGSPGSTPFNSPVKVLLQSFDSSTCRVDSPLVEETDWDSIQRFSSLESNFSQ